MGTLFAIAGASAGGWVGWAAGVHLGVMTGWFASVVGSAVGVYYGRRAWATLMD